MLRILNLKGMVEPSPEDQLTQVKLLEQLKEIENDRESIIKQMETYRESYTKDLFNKILRTLYKLRRCR